MASTGRMRGFYEFYEIWIQALGGSGHGEIRHRGLGKERYFVSAHCACKCRGRKPGGEGGGLDSYERSILEW